MIAAIRWARGQHGLPPAAKLVLILLADMANESGVCWPGVALLARDAECDARQTQRHLRLLEGRGLLQITRRPGQTNLYILQMGGVTPAPPPEQTGGDTGDIPMTSRDDTGTTPSSDTDDIPMIPRGDTGATPKPAGSDTDDIPMASRDDTGTRGVVTPAPPKSSKNLKDKDDDDKAYHHHQNGGSGDTASDPGEAALESLRLAENRRWAAQRYPGDLLRQGYVWLHGELDEADLQKLTGQYGVDVVTDVLHRIREAEIKPANPMLYLRVSLEREKRVMAKERAS